MYVPAKQFQTRTQYFTDSYSIAMYLSIEAVVQKVFYLPWNVIPTEVLTKIT